MTTRLPLFAFARVIGAAYLALAAWPATSDAAPSPDANRYHPDRIECRKVQRKRSFTKRRVCATRREWDEAKARSLEILRQRDQTYAQPQIPGRR